MRRESYCICILNIQIIMAQQAYKEYEEQNPNSLIFDEGNSDINIDDLPDKHKYDILMEKLEVFSKNIPDNTKKTFFQHIQKFGCNYCYLERIEESEGSIHKFFVTINGNRKFGLSFDDLYQLVEKMDDNIKYVIRDQNSDCNNCEFGFISEKVSIGSGNDILGLGFGSLFSRNKNTKKVLYLYGKYIGPQNNE